MWTLTIEDFALRANGSDGGLMRADWVEQNRNNDWPINCFIQM
jgi:hypothetical protein